MIHTTNKGMKSLSVAQQSHLDKLTIINGDLKAIQFAIIQGHDNITLQQALIMDKFESMLDVIDGLGQSALDASDRLQSLNVLLTTLTGFPGLRTLLKWAVPVSLVAFFNRTYAVLLVLIIRKYPSDLYNTTNKVSSMLSGNRFILPGHKLYSPRRIRQQRLQQYRTPTTSPLTMHRGYSMVYCSQKTKAPDQIHSLTPSARSRRASTKILC